jgi:hypothetical protein
MTNRANVMNLIMLGFCAVWLGCGGCAAPPQGPVTEAQREVSGAEPGQFVTAAELDELTRAFADRYVGLLYSVCDVLKKDNPDPAQRREAQLLLIDSASNMYDIASNADSFTRLLDMVVVTKLMSHVWVDDGRAEQIFGDRAEPLIHAMVHSRDEAQELARRVLTDDHLAVLDALLTDWRAENREMIHASFVRFSNFAIGRGRSAASEVLAARGMFAGVGMAGQAVDEARLLGERVFYHFKRQPTLLRWQLEAAKHDLLATPELVSTLANMDRLTSQIEQLPVHIAAEREVIFTSVDSRMERADTALAKVKDIVAETKGLIAALEEANESLDPLLTKAESIFTRYDEWHRWAVDSGRPRFDIREYTEMVKETATTSQELDQLLITSADLLASPDWRARIDEWNRAADGRIAEAAEQSEQVLSGLFRRIYLALGVLFVLIVCYRVFSILLSRKLAARETLPSSHR